MDSSSAFPSFPEESPAKKRVDAMPPLVRVSSPALSPSPEQFPLKKPRVERCNCEKAPEVDSEECNREKLPEVRLGGDDDVSDYEDDDIDEDTLREYTKQVKESEGFDVDDFPGFHMWGTIEPFINFQKSPRWCNHVKHFSIAAIEHFNEKNDACYEFVEAEKLNIRTTSTFKCFITFKAKDIADQDYPEVKPKTFQAKVDFGPNGVVVDFCRFKPFS